MIKLPNLYEMLNSIFFAKYFTAIQKMMEIASHWKNPALILLTYFVPRKFHGFHSFNYK